MKNYNVGRVDGFEINIGKRRKDNGRRVSFSKSKGGYRLGEVYFNGNRPMDTGGSVIDDLIWRRTEANKPPIPNKKMKSLIETALKAQYFIDITSCVYSRFAGCRCGCSPGYVIHGVVDETARNNSNVDWRSEWYFDSGCYGRDELAVYVSTTAYADELARKEKERLAQERAKKAAAFDRNLSEGANL
jgi:hypothetical protein